MPAAAAQSVGSVDPEQLPNVVADPAQQAEQLVNEVTGDGGDPGDEFGEGNERDARSGDGPALGFGRRIAESFGDHWFLATGGLVLALSALGAAGAVLATRYVDPKECLQNPQRSMLYGYIKGNPGVHLKQLSESFKMKTSTVLWHIRKLEGAELVKSGKANGYRVFYPTAGGIEAKKLSTAIACMSNGNARSLFDYVLAHPGTGQRSLSDVLTINPGTVRWHMRKLRDAGLVAELVQERVSTYFATELGMKAARQVIGLPPGLQPQQAVARLPLVGPLPAATPVAMD
jgi:predicted transcriptional regulator